MAASAFPQAHGPPASRDGPHGGRDGPRHERGRRRAEDTGRRPVQVSETYAADPLWEGRAYGGSAPGPYAGLDRCRACDKRPFPRLQTRGSIADRKGQQTLQDGGPRADTGRRQSRRGLAPPASPNSTASFPADTPRHIPHKGRARNERVRITPEQIAMRWRRRTSPRSRRASGPGFPTRRIQSAPEKTVGTVDRTDQTGSRIGGEQDRGRAKTVRVRGKGRRVEGLARYGRSGDEGSSDRGPGDRTDRPDSGNGLQSHQPARIQSRRNGSWHKRRMTKVSRRTSP